MSKTKAELVEEAVSYGIKNGDEIPYGQLKQMIRDVKNGGAANRKAIDNVILVRGKSPQNLLTALKTVPVSGPVQTVDPLESDLRVLFYRDISSKWRWQLLAGNGRIVADSGEGYATRWGCRRAFKKFIGL